MTLNLKRKRGKDAEPRKARKIVDEDSNINGSDNNLDDPPSEDSGDMDVEDGSEAGERDYEEWGGLDPDPKEQGIVEGHQLGTKPKKPPTGEELRTIKDATDLFRSSSFKLQIDALLPNVRPKTSRIPPLDRFLLSLHSFLGALPSSPPQHPLEGARRLLKKGVSVPFGLPLPSEDTNWKVEFEKPSDISVVGSWANKNSVKAKDGIGFGVDVAVEMPSSLFQEKDYLNGRFFHKRAFYLATIAAAIKNSKSGLNADVLYDSYSDDPRLTKLVLVSKRDDSQTDFTRLNAQVCIIPVLSPQSPIILHRLAPSHSNIRITSTTTDDSTTTNLPTPIYNTALLRALTPKPQLLATYTLQKETPAFDDALTLLRVWANQRGYGPGSKLCIRGFESMGSWWGALLALLISGEERAGAPKSTKRKPLGRGLSSYQLFRAALDFLAKHDYENDPVFLRTQGGKHRYAPEEYQQNHGAVFVDAASMVNMLSGVPLGSLELLRHDALKTLEKLDESSLSGDPFTGVFLTDHRDLPTRFDTLLRVDLSSASPLNSSIQLTMDTGSPANALITSLTSLLRRGLGNRAKAVAVLSSPSPPRSLSQAHPSNPSLLYIGLIHHPQNAFRLVDHGPAADDEDQEEKQRFRDFWGNKAELRRFKDGRIIESVVWDVKTADERAHIPGMIVRHLLSRHFGVGGEGVQMWQTPFDSVLRLPEAISSLYLGSGVATGSKGALTAFDNLVKRIKALDDDLPLALSNVSPISEQLRYTSVFSPVPLPPSLASTMPQTARYLSPINVVLEFEKSSKWPDDLKAIQKIKLAFFERLASVLMSSTEGLKATVVVGDGVSASEVLDQASLEILTPEGWAFSTRIWHDREATLLDRIIDNKKTLPHVTQKSEDHKRGREYRNAVEAKEVYTRRFIHAPRHHRAIASLSHQYSAYAGTARLAKRWLASHWLLHGHITEEAVEILCASLFVGDGKNVGADPDVKIDERANIPGSKERGFAAFVALLKGWTWEEGLFVPLYGKDATALVEPSHLSGAKASTGGVWNISTELDKDGRMWTSHGPDLVVARRVKALAKATWDLLQGVEQGTLNVKSLFVHPTDDYDFVVRLDPLSLPRYFHNVTVDTSLLSRRGKYVNLLEDSTGGIRPGFDPARMLFADLQRVYVHTFKVFFDPFGGDRFGVVWDPTLKQPRPFRVLGEFSSVPIKKENEKGKDKSLVSLNEVSVLSEIERLGLGLVSGIIVHV